MSTIAAISTPMGSGGIAVIRISGDEAFCIADKLFVCQKAKRLFELDANTVVLGKVYDENKKLIDEALVSIFKAPHSFTGEDVIEISCHGGILIAKKVLKTAIYFGAQLASKGEFTKRAFLNGKLDLTQAEGIIDLINSVSEKGAENAVYQLEGRLSKNINDIRNKLLDVIENISAAIDFPDEGIEELEYDNIKTTLQECLDNTGKLIDTADYGKIIKDGIPIAVIGKPNVGKSSLLNALSGTKKAIVTDIAGTTRDIVEEYVNIDGIAIKLMDTAGIHDTDDKVETIGVKRSVEATESAGIILAVFDNSEPFTEEDKKILDLIKDKKHIIVLNKCDKAQKNEIDGIKISAKELSGLDNLSEKIAEIIKNSETSFDNEIITNERHFEALVKSKEALTLAYNAHLNKMPVDLVALDIQRAIESYGEIVGLTVSEEIIDNIFSKFCVGK